MNIQIFEESDLVDRRSGAIYEGVYVSSTRDPRTEGYQDGIRMVRMKAERPLIKNRFPWLSRFWGFTYSEHYFPR